jgi:dTDP-4-dehydrorhamnose 3,5-epimerase-like enzyme
MKIIPLEPFSRDDRGYVGEYYHDRIGQHLIVFCNAGAVRGRHYHKGISITKNPEILIVLSGKVIVNWRGLNETTVNSQFVPGPARIEIPAYTWHEFVAETECTFLELNSLSEHKADTFYEE